MRYLTYSNCCSISVRVTRLAIIPNIISRQMATSCKIWLFCADILVQPFNLSVATCSKCQILCKSISLCNVKNDLIHIKQLLKISLPCEPSYRLWKSNKVRCQNIFYFCLSIRYVCCQFFLQTDDNVSNNVRSLKLRLLKV